MRAVYLTPHSTFPSVFPSNTLFGAICTGLFDLDYDLDDLIERYPEDPAFILSSAFPYLNAGGAIHHFLPSPLLPPPKIRLEEDFDKAKAFKKVRYIHEAVFHDLAGGKLRREEIIGDLDNYAVESGMLARKREYLPLDRAETEIPHNRINRITSESEEFYHTYGSIFRRGGRYFLIRFYDRAWEAPVEAALRLLEDRGVGPRTSGGQGQFSLSFGEMEIPEDAGAPYLMSLSRFAPESLAAFKGRVWYDLVSIRGRSGDGVMKKSVRMLSEGSVFANLHRPSYGTMATVRDSPRVIEYGMAFPVGIRWSG